MISLGLSVPLSIGILAIALFYMAFKYRDQQNFSWYEIFFSFGNLFLLSALWMIYFFLDDSTISFSEVVLPIFFALLWIYIIAVLTMFYKVFRMILSGLNAYRREKKW